MLPHNNFPQHTDDLQLVFPLMNLLPVAIYHCDMNGSLTFYNDAAAKLWGQPLKIGEANWHRSIVIYDSTGHELALEQWPMMRALREKRVVESEEILIQRENGSRIKVISHPRPIYNPKGEMTGAINTLIDITERGEKNPEQREARPKIPDVNLAITKKTEFTQTEARYVRMIEEVEDYAIILLDVEGNILNWNKGAEKIKGYSESEIIGKNFRLFYLEKDRSEKLPETLIMEAAKKGKAMHEGWRMRKDGTTFWGNIVITALHDNNQNVIGFSKVTRDLTERKIAEDRLRAYAREVEVRNKRLEEYAYIASHDLQEPLRKIQIFAELLEDNLHDEQQARKNLQKITSSAQRMSVLIKDVLNYSQLTDSANLFQTIDLNTIVDEVLNDFELLIDQRNVKLQIGNLPTVKGISIQLQQLFSNLISNAIKFSGDQPIVQITCGNATPLEVAAVGLTVGNYYRIDVADNGSGFDPKYAEQVFQLFQRLNSRQEGTGIGLALSRKIVENHKGAISVKSETNKGTVFSIFFPAIT